MYTEKNGKEPFLFWYYYGIIPYKELKLWRSERFAMAYQKICHKVRLSGTKNQDAKGGKFPPVLNMAGKSRRQKSV
jgi:hypothetical protein